MISTGGKKIKGVERTASDVRWRRPNKKSHSSNEIMFFDDGQFHVDSAPFLSFCCRPGN
jgi:hypothetical protein